MKKTLVTSVVVAFSLCAKAQETAISNGIFDMAKDNAEIIVKAFLSDLYSFDADGKDGKGQYTIEFEYPREA